MAPVDPQAQAVLDQMAAPGGPESSELSISEAREAYKGLAGLSGEPPPVEKVEDRRVPGPGGEIPVRVYTPSGAPEDAAPASPGELGLPAVVFFHGGSFSMGDLDLYDVPCRALASGAGCLVVAVAYRLAPENPFPAAVEDAYAATGWVAEHAGDLGGDPSRVAVMGDSAGGTIAAVVALLARERGGPELAFQALVYPNTDATLASGSWEAFDGYVLTREGMRGAFDAYLREGADPKDWRVSPLFAPDLEGLPPALVVTGEYDPLRDEGETYAAHLREAGVPVRHTRYPGMIHGFFQMAGALDAGGRVIGEISGALRTALGKLDEADERERRGVSA